MPLTVAGISTGKVFCGSVGSDKRQEYAMVGDTVNLSARLMGVAHKGNHGILCDEATYHAVIGYSRLMFEALPAVSVKGKSQPVLAHIQFLTQLCRSLFIDQW